jgi:hypothetical protein
MVRIVHHHLLCRLLRLLCHLLCHLSPYRPILDLQWVCAHCLFGLCLYHQPGLCRPLPLPPSGTGVGWLSLVLFFYHSRLVPSTEICTALYSVFPSPIATRRSSIASWRAQVFHLLFRASFSFVSAAYISRFFSWASDFVVRFRPALSNSHVTHPNTICSRRLEMIPLDSMRIDANTRTDSELAGVTASRFVSFALQTDFSISP